ncbi:hypothetical protein [Sessilibacter sp. MAH2]
MFSLSRHHPLLNTEKYLIHVCGIVVSVCLYLLFSAAGSEGFPSLPLFYSVMALVFSCSVIAAISIQSNEIILRSSSLLIVSAVFTWPVIFRLIAVQFYPVFEDDHYRFLWDGYVFFEYATPYGVAPSEFFGNNSVPSSMEDILGGINYPDIPTIYGPVTELIFLLSYWLFPADIFGLQLLSALFDLGVIGVLWRVAPRWGAVLYAWSPLIIKEFSLTAHPDIYAVFFLGVSFLCLKKNYQVACMVFLAIAVCTKVFAILLVPLFAIRCRWFTWPIFVVVVGAIYAPFYYLNNADLYGLFAFAQNWQFNGSIVVLLNQIFDIHTTKIITALLFCCLYAVYWFYFVLGKKADIRGDWVFAVFFLLAPVVNAWYLVWLLFFAAIYPSLWAWFASFMILLSYVNGFNILDGTLELYEQPHWARWLEYGSVIAVWVIEVIVIRTSSELRAQKKAPSL